MIGLWNEEGKNILTYDLHMLTVSVLLVLNQSSHNPYHQILYSITYPDHQILYSIPPFRSLNLVFNHSSWSPNLLFNHASNNREANHWGVPMEAPEITTPYSPLSSTTRTRMYMLHPVKSVMLSVQDVLCFPLLRSPSIAPGRWSWRDVMACYMSEPGKISTTADKSGSWWLPYAFILSLMKTRVLCSP